MSTSWADFAEEEDGEVDLQVELPARTETAPDAKGIKKVVFYERRDDGSVVKVTQRVKVIKLRQQIPLRALKRRKEWKPFGKAAAGPEEGVTYVSKDDVFMITPAEDDADTDDSPDILNKVKAAMSKSTFGQAKPRRLGAPKPAAAAGGEKTGAYKHPGHGLARPAGAPMRGMDDQVPALRVSNITPNATKDDLYELFQSFGRIARLYLADPPKCFAFVTYTSQDDGKKAMKKLDGYPYGHLILKVEWAKPSTNRPQNSMRFATGYGGALPQDKERQQNK